MKKCLEILIVFLMITFPILIILSVPNIMIDNNVVVNYNEEYIDEVYAKTVFRDYSDELISTGDVDTSKLGKYEIDYKLRFGMFTISNKKDVFVVDEKAPVITLKGDKEVTICPNSMYKEDGYEVVDEYDGDITNNIRIMEKDNQIIYMVSDSSLNKAEERRNILYGDNEEPEIELKGNDEVYVYKNASYNELGYSAIDNCEGDITSKVEVVSNVDTSKVGNYEVKYSVVDSNNNSSTVTRKVVVINRISNYSSGNADGKIYLTFDDGPSYLTTKILDILDEEGVKVTFFVTSNVEVYPHILRRAYNSGHAIALHTYSHDYGYIYSSTNNFFDDLQRVDNAVYNIIGKKSYITRFPGGSSNLISRRYSYGIMSILGEEVVRRGYNYFDWNVDSNDAGGDINNSNKIYSNVVNNLSFNKANIVLMHDSSGHDATVAALRDIIKYGKNNGFEFSVLSSDMNAVRHAIAN